MQKTTTKPSRTTKIMKPTVDIRNRSDSIILPTPASRVFQKTDFDRISAGCRRSSFRAISHDYFTKEARQHFSHEAVLFFVMMMTVALPLLNASIAVLKLVRV
jgi:hypothetical protein